MGSPAPAQAARILKKTPAPKAEVKTPVVVDAQRTKPPMEKRVVGVEAQTPRQELQQYQSSASNARQSFQHHQREYVALVGETRAHHQELERSSGPRPKA